MVTTVQEPQMPQYDVTVATIRLFKLRHHVTSVTPATTVTTRSILPSLMPHPAVQRVIIVQVALDMTMNSHVQLEPSTILQVS